MAMGFHVTVPSVAESMGDYIVLYVAGDEATVSCSLMMVLPLPGEE